MENDDVEELANDKIVIQPQEDDCIKMRLLTLGESNVGKTSIVRRYIDNIFIVSHVATIGVDFKIKNLVVRDKNIQIKLFDTAGQERYRTITSNYYKGANGILLVYEVTSKATFEKINDWLAQIQENADIENISLVLVGNKIDESNSREVSIEEGQKLAKNLGCPFFETSAKDGTGIREVFEKAAEVMVDRYLEKLKQVEELNKNAINLEDTDIVQPQVKKGGCCSGKKNKTDKKDKKIKEEKVEVKEKDKGKGKKENIKKNEKKEDKKEEVSERKIEESKKEDKVNNEEEFTDKKEEGKEQIGVNKEEIKKEDIKQNEEQSDIKQENTNEIKKEEENSEVIQKEKIDVKTEESKEVQPEEKADIKPEDNNEVKQEELNKDEPEGKTDVKLEENNGDIQEDKVENKQEEGKVENPEVQQEDKNETKTEDKEEVKQEENKEDNIEVQQEEKNEVKLEENKNDNQEENNEDKRKEEV